MNHESDGHQGDAESRPKQEAEAFRLDLSYVGTDFHGFQAQPTKNTIQDELEKALKTILGHPVRIRGASRTDSGVHARHQVAVFRTHRPYSNRWIFGLNALTPDAIGIHSLVRVAGDFDPVFGSTGKAYRYRLWQGRCFNPFVKPFVWSISQHLDPSLLEKIGQQFVGTHDFAAFCNKDSDAKTTVRTINEFSVKSSGPLIDIWITGEGFLKQMIRIMVGTLVEVALCQAEPDTISRLLIQDKDRKFAGATAPPQGLTLVEVFFGDIPPAKNLQKRASAGYCQSIPDNHIDILAPKTDL